MKALSLSPAQRQRLEAVHAEYRRLYEDPAHCAPMFMIETPVQVPPWGEQLADPMVMLNAELEKLRPHLEMEDDHAATVRVQFGTAQVAFAFGCAAHLSADNLPAAKGPVLAEAEDVYQLHLPSLDAGWYGKLHTWIDTFQQHLPEGVAMQLPDIQSPFNSAHLMRGNDILTDFYDDPEAVEALLDKVTAFMIPMTLDLNRRIGHPAGWFFDWGALWKGAARLSNCSSHMISPDMYRQHVLPRDIRFLEAIGGGRIHYCGSSPQVIDAFLENPAVTGLDYDLRYHDLWELSRRVPAGIPMMHVRWDGAETDGQASDAIVQRLLDGDWPEKRNIIFKLYAPSVPEGKELLRALRTSFADSHPGR